MSILVSGNTYSGAPLTQIFKVDPEGLITSEAVELEFPADAAFSDGELLFTQLKTELSVFKIIEADGSTKFELVTKVNLHQDELLVGYAKSSAKI